MTQNITQKNYVDSYGEFFCKIGFPVIFVSPFATTIHDLSSISNGYSNGHGQTMTINIRFYDFPILFSFLSFLDSFPTLKIT